ncbi:hypothetical protein DEMA109039_01985 [Deinococcus marmoris]
MHIQVPGPAPVKTAPAPLVSGPVDHLAFVVLLLVGVRGSVERVGVSQPEIGVELQ